MEIFSNAGWYQGGAFLEDFIKIRHIILAMNWGFTQPGPNHERPDLPAMKPFKCLKSLILTESEDTVRFNFANGIPQSRIEAFKEAWGCFKEKGAGYCSGKPVAVGPKMTWIDYADAKLMVEDGIGILIKQEALPIRCGW